MSDEMVVIIYIAASIAVFPAIIFALIAQVRVSTTFHKYSKHHSREGKTGAQIAEELLMKGNVNGHVRLGSGYLSDHYDPRTKTVSLSSEVFHGDDIASLGVAAHEVGHAIQDEEGYPPLKIRQFIIKSTSFVNRLLLPLVMLSFIVQVFVFHSSAYADIMLWILLAFAVIYLISFLINVITLPTEYNASKRAVAMLAESGMSEEELRGVKKVLNAAALTYVASLIISFVELLRILMRILIIARSRD